MSDKADWLDELAKADAKIIEQAEEIRRLRREVAKLRKLTQWQPIETAPACNVILFYPPETNQSAWITIGFGRSAKFRKPTHWMPIPEPPAVEG